MAYQTLGHMSFTRVPTPSKAVRAICWYNPCGEACLLLSSALAGYGLEMRRDIGEELREVFDKSDKLGVMQTGGTGTR